MNTVRPLLFTLSAAFAGTLSAQVTLTIDRSINVGQNDTSASVTPAAPGDGWFTGPYTATLRGRKNTELEQRTQWYFVFDISALSGVDPTDISSATLTIPQIGRLNTTSVGPRNIKLYDPNFVWDTGGSNFPVWNSGRPAGTAPAGYPGGTNLANPLGGYDDHGLVADTSNPDVEGSFVLSNAALLDTVRSWAADPADNEGFFMSYENAHDIGLAFGAPTLQFTTSELPPNTGPVFPFVDSDGDSYSDIAETAFGSSPADPADCPDHSSSPATPNVVIIYADDMGLGDMSAYGELFGTPSPAVTPHMDSLAAEGTLFTQAHSSNAVCTPSRYSLLTGKYNWREFDGISKHYGYSTAISELPKASDVTIAEFLKTQAYDTAAFGKWHLGGKWFPPRSNSRITTNPSNPTSIDWARPVEDHAVAHGFDTFQGLATTINFGPYVYLENDRNQIWDPSLNDGSGAFRDATNSDTFQWLTTSDLNSSVVGAKDSRASLGDPTYRQVDAGPFMITQVEEFIAARESNSDPDPFFAYVSLYSPHKPWALTPPFIGSDSAAGFHYADFMREVDDRIGRVIDAIDNHGFRDNTIIIITSDNGPENTAMEQSLNFSKDPNGPLRGNKRDVWEGGTRVPFVIRWPGQAAAGMKISDPIWQGDIFATVAAYLGVDLPSTTAPDGESFLNLIRGQQKPAPQRDGIVVSSIRADLGLKTTDGWKFIDATGGGNGTSWDSSNAPIPNATGTNQGTPKQLFHLDLDLGEDDNLISTLTDDTDIRNELTDLTGTDLLGSLDLLRDNTTSVLFPRVADNDADTLPNSYELLYGLDPNSPKDAIADLDGDGSSNGDEHIAGTDPTNPNDYFRIVDIQNFSAEFTVTWPSVLDRTYTVFWSTDGQDWTADSVHSGTGGSQQATLDKAAIDDVDGIQGNLTNLFVRIGVEAP